MAESAGRDQGIVTLRGAEAADAAAIARLLERSFARHRHDYTDAGWAATVPGDDGVLMRLREGPIWVAERDAEVVGTVSAVERSPGVYLRGMAVLPAARGAGVGARLVHRVTAWARARRQRIVWLSTTPFLHAAIRLYEREGFSRAALGPDDLAGVPLFAMMLRLDDDPPAGREGTC